MNVSEITLYEILKTKFSQQEASDIVGNLKGTVKEEIATYKDTLATKQDLFKLKVDMIKWMVTLFVAQTTIIIGLYLKTK